MVRIKLRTAVHPCSVDTVNKFLGKHCNDKTTEYCITHDFVENVKQTTIIEKPVLDTLF